MLNVPILTPANRLPMTSFLISPVAAGFAGSTGAALAAVATTVVAVPLRVLMVPASSAMFASVVVITVATCDWSAEICPFASSSAVCMVSTRVDNSVIPANLVSKAVRLSVSTAISLALDAVCSIVGISSSALSTSASVMVSIAALPKILENCFAIFSNIFFALYLL